MYDVLDTTKKGRVTVKVDLTVFRLVPLGIEE
jgi:hypothetical protein